MHKTAYIAIACGLIFLVGGLYYFLKEEPLPPAPPDSQAAGKQSIPNLTFSGSTIVEEKDGKRIWELSAEIIEADTSQNIATLKNIKGVFYQEKGGKIDIVAKEAVLDTKTKDISLQGDIQATASDGAVFTAPQAKWSDKNKVFSGTGGIKLIRGDTIITGDTIETDASMEKVKVQGNARVLTGGTPNAGR
ncbi:MAG TPA: LPS export ABC transporter periplasmic protein LptC [Methylomusa anaerophila]|uniref:Lipopolysaccharide-assembly, LptC-related n=1 Tax=Methylomusa anaerophila TaxID=1930071 RepID=A0A348AKI0_9FIRM|nr:LPS export ABC transporter periplasmic protein LptC [Methylomusa anaerophila]BBB91578.1 lipopolysaccharide-assembly, LptC-related [Methylomusa anaerophila]HML89484.1 LPS export ABC transporter periplasmic protein LptC [Methylomusa anaerophila]